jgi:hypothetical protein
MMTTTKEDGDGGRVHAHLLDKTDSDMKNREITGQDLLGLRAMSRGPRFRLVVPGRPHSAGFSDGGIEDTKELVSYKDHEKGCRRTSTSPVGSDCLCSRPAESSL